MTFLVVSATLAHAGEPDFSIIDRNENGVIEPTEIPAQELTVIARYASLSQLDISQPMPVEALLNGRAKYLQSLDGGGTELQLAGANDFGRMRDSGVRPFGIVGEFSNRYTPEARRGTISVFQKFDANRDGLLTQEELSVSYRSNVESWMRGDRDANGILTFPELANAVSAERERRKAAAAHQQSTWIVDGVEITAEHRAYAARLMNKFDKSGNGRLGSDEIPNDWKTDNVLLWADLNRDGQITGTEMHTGAARFLREEKLARQRKNDPNMRDCAALSADMMRRYDIDKDQSLGRSEWQRLGGHIANADLNGNGLIVSTELTTWLLGRLTSQPGAGLPENLPDWFLESDGDLNGQVMLAEFIASQTIDRHAEFSHYDRDADGIVTPAECQWTGGAGRTQYVSLGPRVLEAQKEVISEVFVPDEIRILDVDVQVSILKDGDDDLDIRLIGPDGTTASLYYDGRQKAWGGGRMFNNTIIDDEAPQSPQRLPSPPAHRSFRPQSMNDPKKLSLRAFYGKPAKGTWQLIVGNKAQNRGQSAGLLEGWALLVQPASTDSEGRGAPPIRKRQQKDSK